MNSRIVHDDDRRIFTTMIQSKSNITLLENLCLSPFNLCPTNHCTDHNPWNNVQVYMKYY